MEKFPQEEAESQKESGVNRVVGFGQADEAKILDYFKHEFENNPFDKKWTRKNQLNLKE